MTQNNRKTNELIDSTIKDLLRDHYKATDDELQYLEKLLRIQHEKSLEEKRELACHPQASVIINGFLYQGDLGHAIDVENLLDLQITHLINACDCPINDERNEIFQISWIRDLEDHPLIDIRRHFDNDCINEQLFQYTVLVSSS